AELYTMPRNLFVAGFIGSPAMNFLNATLEDSRLRSPFGDLPLDDRTRQALERHNAPREVIIGLRPEAFEDASLAREDSGAEITVTVDVLESLGSDAYVYFTAEGGPASTAELEELATDSGQSDTGAGTQQIVARLDAATRAREGEPMRLRVDMRKAHVFDPPTGKNLTHMENADGGCPLGPGRAARRRARPGPGAPWGQITQPAWASACFSRTPWPPGISLCTAADRASCGLNHTRSRASWRGRQSPATGTMYASDTAC